MSGSLWLDVTKLSKTKLTTKRFMSLRWPPESEKSDVVMPVRIAGIQARTDASGNIHVSLDSSAPCWNDATETTLPKLTKSELTLICKEAAKHAPDHMRAGAVIR